MLVTSSQSSTQRPLGLSVEELFALDRQYRRIEQQQQHLAQLQNQARITSSNLNRLTSRSLDLISSNPTTLPSLEIHGHGYPYRSHYHSPSPAPIIPNYSRSHSIDHLRYTQPPSSSSVYKSNYHQHSSINDSLHPNYHSKHRAYIQQSPMVNDHTTSSTLDTHHMYNIPSTRAEQYDARASCKLRRQHPVKRESSRRIVVRPVIQRRREPSIGSSCESLDELCSTINRLPTEQSNISNPSGIFTPSASLLSDVIDNLQDETKQFKTRSSTPDSLNDDDGETNLYEMRVPIGKTYDTSDISVQLEGPKILIHCHTIEPTDKRGNYRKHEFKTELLVPDIVDDETIIAYLTEDGQLIVEGKYHSWAWKEIRRKRQLEQKEKFHVTQNPTTNPTRTDGIIDTTKISQPHKSNSYSINFIENLDNNRTLIHVGDKSSSDTKTVSDIINQFNRKFHSTIYDGQYYFTSDQPSLLIYHLRLPFETFIDDIRIQSDTQLNLLKIFIEQQERNSLETNCQQANKVIIRSTSRICRLPRDHTYDFAHLRVIFLKDNFIRIELPTTN